MKPGMWQGSDRNGEGCPVWRRCDPAVDHCNLTVNDEGCGIPPSSLPHIFERFYRGDASRSRATGGVGLGLSIAKALTLRANGTISARSELGKGSTFTVVLPSA
jgi:signal transduction histidine kinase